MRIGFIGLGNIGGPAALNLIKGGHLLAVHDIRRAAATAHLEMGANWAGSPAEAARDADAVFTSLPFPKDVEAVTLGPGGITESLSAGAVYGDMTTSSVSLTRKLHALFKERGVDMLDMPITGGHAGSLAATMVIFVGGDEPVYRRLKPVLELMGKPVHCGPGGSGNVCKLVNNLIGHSFGQVVTEAFTIGVKAGVPLETLIRALSMGGHGQPFVPNVRFTGKYQNGSRLELSAASVRLACELARELHVPAEVANVVEQRFIEALAKGWGNLSPEGIQKVYFSRSGVELRQA
jgi:3-hydroxyisobutyrate dehydrogenase